MITKQELEEKIANGEYVYVVDIEYKRVLPYKANEIGVIGINNDNGYILDEIYNTKAEAEQRLKELRGEKQ